VKNFVEALQWLLDSTAMWLQCAARPVATLNNILLEENVDNYLLKTTKVWIPSLLISLIISFPVLKLYGIEWNNVGFHLCTWTTTITALVITAFIFHQILLWLKLKSAFVCTFMIYSVLVTTYAPVSSLLAIPSTLQVFAAIQEFKQHPVALDSAVVTFVQHASHPTTISARLSSATSIVISFFSTGILALFAESMSQWYGNDRFKCYAAIAASLLLSTAALFLIITPMQFLAIYAFVVATPG
jgi:hypothetical protein